MKSSNSALVTCSCGALPTYAQTQYKVQHPDLPVPTLYVSKKAYSLLETFPSTSEAYQFLSGVLKKRGRYAYLMEWDDSFSLTHVWNYQTNRKVV